MENRVLLLSLTDFIVLYSFWIKRFFLFPALLVLMLTSIDAQAVTPLLATTVISGESSETETPPVLNSPEAVRDMVSRLSDEDVRALLLQRLDAVVKEQQPAAKEASTSMLTFLENWGLGVVDSVKAAVIRLPVLFVSQQQSFSNFVEKRGLEGSLFFLGVMVLSVIVGYLSRHLVGYFFKGWRRSIDQPHAHVSYQEAFKFLSQRFLLDMIGLIVFIVVAVLVINSLQEDADKRISRVLLFSLVVFPRFMVVLAQFFLAPHRPELRIVHTDDWTAKFLYQHQMILFISMGVMGAIIQFNEFNGLRPGQTRLGFWMTLLTHGYIIFIAWKARKGLTAMLMGDGHDVTSNEARVARIYPYFLIGLSVFIWLITELLISIKAFEIIRHGPHYFTMVLFMILPVVDTVIRGAVAYLLPPMSGEGEVAARAYLSTKRSYIRIARILIFGLGIYFLTNLWNIRFEDIASRGVGAQAAAHLIQLLVIFSIGYLIWELATLLINRKLAAEHTAAGFDLQSEEPGGGEGGGAGASRLSTILPLFRFTLQSIIVVMTVLIGLSNIGINITPLLAGAGVVGIAVGFGAQKLVADVVSGVFFLIDDAFRAGEYISVDTTLGTVEKISLRSMQLRHHRGPVHTIPYGEIPKLTNYSRDWVIMKLRFTVPFDTDLNKVKKIFKQIGKEMMELPEYKEDFIQPFKSQGVLEVDDVGIVIRGKFMAKPGTQFMIRKDLYQRVQQAFDENGIQFARKEVRVKLDGVEPETLNEEQKSAVAAAATDAAEEPPVLNAATN